MTPARPLPRRRDIPPASVWLAPDLATRTSPIADRIPCCERWIQGRLAHTFADRSTLHVSRSLHPAAPTADLTFLCDVHLREKDPQGVEAEIPKVAPGLSPNGILAVLTRNYTPEGDFAARCGDLIAHARAASLIYLQHIIAVHATPAPSECESALHPAPPRHSPSRHRVIHSDILIFAAVEASVVS